MAPDYSTLPQKPLLHFPERGYESEIERCHGCAACKSAVATTMCPTYKATAARTRLSAREGQPSARGHLGRHRAASAYGVGATKTVTDYCIGCGMCAVECPSRVDIPKLVLEAKSKYRQKHRPSPAEFLLSHAGAVARLGSAVAPLANRLVSLGPARRAGPSSYLA